MYYMCWYTMLEEPLLAHFGFHCPVPPLHQNEVETEGWQRDYSDYRDRDVGAYDCALLNFCPGLCMAFVFHYHQVKPFPLLYLVSGTLQVILFLLSFKIFNSSRCIILSSEILCIKGEREIYL